MAVMIQTRFCYQEIAEALEEGLTEFANKLCKADLPLKHQHWAMFAILDAYLCLWPFSHSGCPTPARGML